jgi:hypothetical protein
MPTTANYSIDKSVHEILARKTKFSTLMRLDAEVEPNVSTTPSKWKGMKNSDIVKAKGGSGYVNKSELISSGCVAFRTENIAFHNGLACNEEINEDSIRRGYVEDIVRRFHVKSTTSFGNDNEIVNQDSEERQGSETEEDKYECLITHTDSFSYGKSNFATTQRPYDEEEAGGLRNYSAQKETSSLASFNLECQHQSKFTSSRRWQSQFQSKIPESRDDFENFERDFPSKDNIFDGNNEIRCIPGISRDRKRVRSNLSHGNVPSYPSEPSKYSTKNRNSPAERMASRLIMAREKGISDLVLVSSVLSDAPRYLQQSRRLNKEYVKTLDGMEVSKVLKEKINFQHRDCEALNQGHFQTRSALSETEFCLTTSNCNTGSVKALMSASIALMKVNTRNFQAAEREGSVEVN